MIQSIRLQNWKSHADSTLEFRKGTNVLIGVMGSGKSSIVDGISFGLFGTFPALFARKVTLEETIMQKPQPKENATVTVTFEYKQQHYRVERNIFKGAKSSEAKLYNGERIIAGPKPGEVTERIENIMEVDYNLFSRAVYSEQNQIDFFLRLSPRERKQKFDELLEINRYETARQNAVTVQNRLKKNLEDQQRWIQEQKKQFDPASISALEKAIMENETAIQEWQKKENEWKKECEKLQNEIRQQEEIEQQLRRIQQQEAQLVSRIETMEQNIRRVQQQSGGKNVLELGQELKALLEQEKTLLQEQKQAEEHLEQIQAIERNWREQLKVIEHRQQQAEKQLQNTQQLEGACPVCQRPMDAEHKTRLEHELREQHQKLAEEKKTLVQQLAEQKPVLAQLEQKRQENRKKTEETHENKTRKEWLLQQANDLAQQHETIQTEHKKLLEIRTEKDRFPFNEKNLRLLREELLKSKTEETRARQEHKNNEQLKQRTEQQLHQILQIRDKLSQLEKENKALEIQTEKLGLFINSLQTVQALLRENLLEAINEAMHMLWQKTYPYSDFSAIRLAVEEGNYEVKAKTQNGEWIRVEGNLSGGERSTVALCIRMAFSFVLTQNLGWLILDEPTHNLDKNAVQELGKILKHQLPELVEQVFVITHDAALEEAASGSLHEINRDKNNEGTSSPMLKGI